MDLITLGIARILFRLLGRQEASEIILGDMEEEYHERRQRGNGPITTGAWFLRQVTFSLFHEARTRWSTPRWDGQRKQTGESSMLENTLRDIRYAFRGLSRSPGYVIVVTVTLVLGFGANATMFSLVHGTLLKSRPLAHGDRVVNVYNKRLASSDWSTLSYADYEVIRSHDDTFEDVMGYGGLIATMTGRGNATTLFGELVTESYFRMLGIVPQAGRFFHPGDYEGIGDRPVAVISHELWVGAFGSAEDINGETILLNGLPFAIAGVAPQAFRGSLMPGMISTQIWVPTAMRGQFRSESDEMGWMFLKARMHLGLTIAETNAVLGTIATNLGADTPRYREATLTAVPARDVILNPGGDPAIKYATTLLLLTTGLVLVVACTNLANMTVARFADRSRELALRTALGAGRGRLVTQLSTEAAVLAVLGLGVTLLATTWFNRVVAAYRPPMPVDISLDVSTNTSVVLYTTALGLVALVLFGVLPAIRASKADPGSALKTGTGNTPKNRMSHLLLVPQVGVSVVLLTLGALFGRSVMKASAVDPGFDIDRTAMVAFQVGLSGLNEDEALGFYERLAAFAATIPGVTNTTVTDHVPLDIWGNSRTTVSVIGETATDFAAEVATVEHGYFETMGIPLRGGRTFRAREPTAVIVNEAAAATFWPKENPLGKTLREAGHGDTVLTVVGVAADARLASLAGAVRPQIYLPRTGGYTALLRMMVRSEADPGRAAQQIVSYARTLNADVAVFDSGPMTAQLGIVLFPYTLTAAIAVTFGLIGLTLTAVGLFGVVTSGAKGRTREVGIRIALGANARDVIWNIVGRGARFTMFGLAIGVLAAIGAAVLVRSFIFGIRAIDPVTFLAVPVLLLVVSAVAAYLPARRAAQINPVEALRAE